jgi:hypothetical protein
MREKLMGNSWRGFEADEIRGAIAVVLLIVLTLVALLGVLNWLD